MDHLPLIALCCAALFAVLTLLRMPALFRRWGAVRQVYGRIPWSLARQMLWNTRKSPMSFPVKTTFLCIPFTLAGAIRFAAYGDPVEYFLAGFAVQIYALVRTADVILPPTIMLLGTSVQEVTHTLAHLNALLPAHRTVALLQPRERLPFDVVQGFYFNNLRTAHAYEWRSIVFHLMDVVPVIVIDAPGNSAAVAEEIKRIKARGYQSRAVFVGEGGRREGASARVPRDRLAPWIASHLARLTDAGERSGRQDEIAAMLAYVPLRFRDPQTVYDMVTKARYIEDYEVGRFVVRQLGTEPEWSATPLLEDLPPEAQRGAELCMLRTSRGLDEVRTLLIGALEWVAQNPDPASAFNAASAHNKFGRLARLEGKWDEAIRECSDAAAQFERLTGDPDRLSVLGELSVAHFTLGEVYMARYREARHAADRDKAKEHFLRSLAIDRQTGEDMRLTHLRLESL
jgi:hypothetical protein